MYKSPLDNSSEPGTVPTKNYSGKRAYHKGCFGKSNAEKKGYKPRRFKKDFTVDRRSTK